MDVDLKQLKVAMLCWPTRTGQAVLNQAFSMVEAKAVPTSEGVWQVDETTWRKAMNLCARVPYGGRWVWQARRNLWWAIDRATEV